MPTPALPSTTISAAFSTPTCSPSRLLVEAGRPADENARADGSVNLKPILVKRVVERWRGADEWCWLACGLWEMRRALAPTKGGCWGWWTCRQQCTRRPASFAFPHSNDTTVAAVALAVSERVVRESTSLVRDRLTSRSHHAFGPLCKGVHSSLVHITDGCKPGQCDRAVAFHVFLRACCMDLCTPRASSAASHQPEVKALSSRESSAMGFPPTRNEDSGCRQSLGITGP